MSGSNPFRRSQNIAGTPIVTDHNILAQKEDETIAASRRFPSLSIEAPPSISRTSSKQKTVRIASPPASTPISPTYFPSEPSSPIVTRSGAQPTSPLPVQNDSRNSDDSSSDGDPFEAEASDADDDAAQQVLQNTRKNSAITTNTSPDDKDDGADAVRRTLARFSARPPRAATTGTSGATSSEAANPPKTTKQPMDVDAFKRLLMTGSASIPSSQDGNHLQSTIPQLGQVSESSSNTDASSISRQSIFEPPAPPPPPVQNDTPRTSHEITVEEADEELQSLVGHDEKKKPPPPKTRHGKLIKPNPTVSVPQTSNEVDSPPDQEALQSPTPRPAVNVDKPLPVPPPNDTALPSLSIPSNTTVEPPSPSPSVAKRAPTPPITRRKSQRDPTRTGLEIEATARAPLLSPSTSSATSTPVASPASIKAPPAPPTRKANRSGSTASSINQVPIVSEIGHSLTSGSEASLDTTAITDSQRSPPPPPLARHTSTTSIKSVKRLSRLSGGASSMPPPPPPPPRRGRGSSRDSMDSQRPSAAFLNELAGTGTGPSSGRASGESSRNVSGSSNAMDILANLAELQKEVDNLRHKSFN